MSAWWRHEGSRTGESRRWQRLSCPCEGRAQHNRATQPRTRHVLADGVDIELRGGRLCRQEAGALSLHEHGAGKVGGHATWHESAALTICARVAAREWLALACANKIVAAWVCFQADSAWASSEAAAGAVHPPSARPSLRAAALGRFTPS